MRACSSGTELHAFRLPMTDVRRVALHRMAAPNNEAVARGSRVHALRGSGRAASGPAGPGPAHYAYARLSNGTYQKRRYRMSSLDRRTFVLAAAATASVGSIGTVASGAASPAGTPLLAQ